MPVAPDWVPDWIIVVHNVIVDLVVCAIVLFFLATELGLHIVLELVAGF